MAAIGRNERVEDAHPEIPTDSLAKLLLCRNYEKLESYLDRVKNATRVFFEVFKKFDTIEDYDFYDDDLIFLFEYSIDVNAVEDETGNTLLHYAARFYRDKVVKKLLAMGADPQVSNRLYDKPIDSLGWNGLPCEAEGDSAYLSSWSSQGSLPSSNRGSNSQEEVDPQRAEGLKRYEKEKESRHECWNLLKEGEKLYTALLFATMEEIHRRCP